MLQAFLQASNPLDLCVYKRLKLTFIVHADQNGHEAKTAAVGLKLI